ncbi:MAG: 2-oxo acid dehydrogenase subunit E2 [Anaerolineales bacterium]|nr:2-oxo acid dehydrogenase subunit E2 [Anaerolineales bacterium]
MATYVIMPQLGESVVEGTVSKWLKREGEAVNEYDPLIEVNTDKVDTEVPSPAAGTLLKVYVPEGTTVTAGALLAVIGQPGEPLPAADNTPLAADSGGVAHTPAAAEPARAASAQRQRDLGFISPVVAKLASEFQVDLQQVTGTGHGGRITKKDVQAYLGQRPAASAPAQPAAAAPALDELPPWEKPGEGDLFRPTELQFAAPPQLASSAAPAIPLPSTKGVPPASDFQPLASDFIPVEGMRKLIAEHMVRSKRNAPHVTTVFEADLSSVLAHLTANKDQFARDGATLTLTAYFVAAAVAALKAVPIVNSQWTDEKILLKRELNIGMAVALDEGLIVPVVRCADEKSLLGLAREINDLARRARARALRPDEVQGGTFTITNHGVGGSLFATPIINQPQTAILGVGAMQKRVVVINDAIAIRPMVYLTLTFDHRVLDGALADRFMSALTAALQDWR